jgi:lysine-specific demethylase 8
MQISSKTQPIPRIAFGSAEELSRHLAGATMPFIVTGLLDSWKAMRDWTPAHFADRYRGMEVTAFLDLPAEGAPYALRNENHMRKMRFEDFVNLIGRNEKACYIHQLSVGKVPELASETEFRQLLPAGVKSEMLYFWLGSGGTRSGLHFDRFDNLNAQIYGRKSVFLVSPNQSGALYPFPDNVEKSQVDPDKPQLDRFPRFRDILPHTAVLASGEMLFLPRRWWHHFQSLEPSINVNCWYGEHIPVRAVLDVVKMGGPACWGQVARDFVFCGLFRRKATSRLFSDVPTGKFLYDVIAGGIKRRFSSSDK